MIRDAAKQDGQKCTAEGNPVFTHLDDVKIRPAQTLMDDRGNICEILTEAWQFDEYPIVHVYQVTVRPNTVKGWIIHYEQDDRIFVSSGKARIVLYDDRPESSTYQKIQEIYISPERRSLVKIPRLVFHAIENVGNDDMVFINLPTKAYNYESPDKYRIPINSELIPYKFVNATGY